MEEHISGRSTRIGYWADPLYEWELTYEFLRDFPWLPGINSEMRRLQGFYNQMQGKRFGFLFIDPSDNQVINQFVGITSGNPATPYRVIRSYGDPGYGGVIAEPLGIVNSFTAVYLDGISQTYLTDWTNDFSTANNQNIFFLTAGAGHTITVDISSYAFYVHFKDDSVDFNKFAGPDRAGYWGAKKIVLESLRSEPAP